MVELIILSLEAYNGAHEKRLYRSIGKRMRGNECLHSVLFLSTGLYLFIEIRFGLSIEESVLFFEERTSF